MTRSTAIVGSVLAAALVGGALFLRPRPAAREELPPPAHLDPGIRQVLKTKMGQHDLQMKELLSRVVLLDDDGIARAAGAVFDEPSLARPIAGDELNAALPERFFALQEDLHRVARQLVIASGRHDRAAVAEQFAALAKTCVTCHEVYLLAGERP